MKLTRNLLSKEVLFKALGLDNLDDEQENKLFELMMDILEIKVLDAVLSELSEDEQKELTKLLADDTKTSVVKKFLEEHITKVDTLVNGVVKDFASELQDDIKEAKKSLLKN